MAEEIDFENGRNSNFEGLVTLTIRHIVLQQSSTSTYIRTFIQIEETFCGRTDGRTDIFPLYTIRSTSETIRSTFGSRPNNTCNTIYRSTLQPLLLLSCLPADILFQPLAFESHGQCNQTATGIKIIIIIIMLARF